jgi:DNA-binding XRE family transcriptional regulator
VAGLCSIIHIRFFLINKQEKNNWENQKNLLTIRKFQTKYKENPNSPSKAGGTVTQSEIAQQVGISEGHLSQVLSGKYEPGKNLAKKFSKFTGREWTEFLTMTPEEIRAALFAVSNDG